MAKATIPLAGSIQTRDITNYASRDQQFTNCFSYSIGDEITGGRRIYTQKRKGMAAATVSGVGVGNRGSCVWTNQQKLALSFTKSGSSSMQVFDESSTQIGGDIANTDACYAIAETMVGTTATLVGIFRDSGSFNPEAWYYPLAGAWTQITDSDFPSSSVISRFSPPVQKDGYLFWMTEEGKIHNSDINSVSAYSANNNIAAQSMPDAGVGIASTGDYIAAFGSYSIELFKNVGNPSGSPLSSITGSAIRIGAAYSYIKTIGNAIYFQGVNSETGDRGIYRMVDGKTSKISTTEIEKYMTQDSIWSCIGSIKDAGMEHVLFSKETQDILAYCTNNNRWWKFAAASNETLIAALSVGTQLSQITAGNTAKIYTISSNTTEYRDDSVNQTVTIQTAPIDFGTNKVKFWRSLRLIGDKQSSATSITVSFSDDDAINFTTAGTIDMSTDQLNLNGLGSSRRRVWKFTNASNTPLRLESFELEYEVGTS